MKLLTKDQIILLHKQLIDQTGGTDGIRDDGLLESAVLAPYQTFDGKELHPTVAEKAARRARDACFSRCQRSENGLHPEGTVGYNPSDSLR